MAAEGSGGTKEPSGVAKEPSDGTEEGSSDAKEPSRQQKNLPKPFPKLLLSWLKVPAAQKKVLLAQKNLPA